MAELLDLALRIVESTSGSEDIEAFLTHGRNYEVKAFDGDVESVSSSEPRGAGVRVVEGNRVGFAYTTELDDAGLQAVVTQARANLAQSTPDDAVGLAEAWVEAPPDVGGLIDEGQAAVGPEEKVRFTVDLELATRAADPRIRTVEEAAYSDSDTEVAIATSTGVRAAYRRTDAWCYAVAIAEDGGDTEVGFEFDLARGLAAMDHEAVARRAAGRAVAVLGAGKIPSAVMPVVFDPYTAGQFLGVIGAALTAEAVQKGRSLFAGRLGQSVAAAGLTMVDDGRLENAPASGPWDAEGVPTQRTTVIEDGVLKSFLYDLASARREGRASTGNATRSGFKSTPRPAPSNLELEGTDSAADVLRRAGKALLVQDFHGVHSGANPVSGDFSVGVTGRLLDDGGSGRPVKEVTIAAPMLEILARIVAVGDDRRWLPFGGSYGGATTLVSEMTIAGA